MGKRDGEYILAGQIELDDRFFSTIKPKEQGKEKHHSQVIPKEKVGEALPWVYITRGQS